MPPKFPEEHLNGTGVGLFNAISGAGYADIENADGEKGG